MVKAFFNIRAAIKKEENRLVTDEWARLINCYVKAELEAQDMIAEIKAEEKRETGCAMEAIDGRRDPAAVGGAIPGEFDLYAMSCVGARTRGLADAVLAAARSARAAV